jgi:hypothetical protein
MNTICVVNPLVKSPEIVPLQKALKAAKLYNGPLDGIFGQGTGDACYRAKWRLGYPSSAVNHCGGQTLLDYLTGSKALPPTFVFRRHLRGYGISASDRMRQKIVAFAKWGAVNTAQIHYAQVRPMDHLNKVQALPWTTDCSEFVTTIYKWAGAPDPNGFGYNGYGFTGTMLDHGVSIPLFQVQPGDVVIWGSAPGHHTAVFIEAGTSGDPEIVSHGSERGPLQMLLSTENHAQGGRLMTFKRYLPS